MSDGLRMFDCVERARRPTAEDKADFIQWLRATLKPGDIIAGWAQHWPAHPARVYDRWEGGYPRKKDGTKLSPWGIWSINGRPVSHMNPWLCVIQHQHDEIAAPAE